MCFGNLLALFAIVLLVWSAFVWWDLKYQMKGAPSGSSSTVGKIKSMNHEYISSLATIISAVGICEFNGIGFQEFVLVLIVLVTIIVCLINTNFYYCNPFWALLGYKLALINTDGSSNAFTKDAILLFRGELKENENINYHHIADNVFLRI